LFRNRPLFAATFVLLVALTSTPAGAAVRTESRATAHATIVRQRILVSGKPFFPVMLIDQCTADAAARARGFGINLIVNESCPHVSAASERSRLAGYHTLELLSIARPGVRGAGLAGWSFPDEPEGNGWTPDRLRQAYPYLRGSADGLLSFVTTGAGFFGSTYTHTSVAKPDYGRFARLADVAGFDLYPLGHCSTDLGAVYSAQRAFQRLAGPMPTFQWIETGPIKPSYCGGFRMRASELRAEVWLAVAGGARGIGYFTHTWSPEHLAFDVSPELQRELVSLDRLLTALRPALVAPTVASGADTTSVKVVARRAGDKVYVIAVNASRSATNAKLHVPALHNGDAAVFGEGRTVATNGRRLNDAFGPLAVHIYVQPVH
jgi:hypothetical protein